MQSGSDGSIALTIERDYEPRDPPARVASHSADIGWTLRNKVKLV